MLTRNPLPIFSTDSVWHEGGVREVAAKKQRWGAGPEDIWPRRDSKTGGSKVRH